MNRLCLLLVTILACSCGKTRVDYNVKGEFIYYNRLNQPIQIHIRSGINKAKEDHIIAPGSSLTLLTSTDGPKVANPMEYVAGISADTATVQFNDTLCYSEYHNSGPLLHNLNKYTYQKRGDADYIFRFDIDSNLFKLGKTCE